MCPALWVFCMERQPTTLGLQDELDTASNDIQSTGEKRSSWTFWDILIILNYFEHVWTAFDFSGLKRTWEVKSCSRMVCYASLGWQMPGWVLCPRWPGPAQSTCQTHLWSSLHISHLHNPWILHTNLFHSLFILYQSLSCYIYLNLRISQIFPVVSSWCRCHLMSNYLGGESSGSSCSIPER